MPCTINMDSIIRLEGQDRGEVTLKITQPSYRAIDWLLGTGPGRDLVERQIYPNAKEVSEAWSIHHACAEHITGWGERPVHCWEIGSGKTPRASAMILFRSNDTVTATAIDPNLEIRQDGYRTRRLGLFRGTLGDALCRLHPPWSLSAPGRGPMPVFILPHSHAPQNEISDLISATHRAFWVVEMPCCKRHNVDGLLASAGRRYDLVAEYRDRAVLSAKNKIRVWRVEAG